MLPQILNVVHALIHQFITCRRGFHMVAVSSLKPPALSLSLLGDPLLTSTEQKLRIRFKKRRAESFLQIYETHVNM